jgi:glycosyltransferase involved in cell wall biosynthesis
VKYRQAARGSRYYGSRKRPIEQLVSRADVLIVGNTFLRDQLASQAGGAVVLPTCVEVRATRIKAHLSPSPVRIGWIGLQDNLRELDALEPAFRALQRRFKDDALLSVVSSRPYETSAIATEFVPWSLETEAESLLHFDIGIMPLADSLFARGKCAFKAIQCMSFGLPVVASPVGMNSEVVNEGTNGYLARSTDEWSDRLSRLIVSPSLRSELGAAAFETIRDSYSTEQAMPIIRDALRSTR